MAEVKVIKPKENQNLFSVSTIEAPLESVFAAFLDADLLRQWWVGPGYKARVNILDPRAGGRWEFVNYKEGEEEVRFHGVFHDILPNKLIVQTFEFDWPEFPSGLSLSITKFSAVSEEKTKIEELVVSLNEEARDSMADDGMEKGMQALFTNLEKVLKQRSGQG